MARALKRFPHCGHSYNLRQLARNAAKHGVFRGVLAGNVDFPARSPLARWPDTGIILDHEAVYTKIYDVVAASPLRVAHWVRG